jgi:hypothetical protein
MGVEMVLLTFGYMTFEKAMIKVIQLVVFHCIIPFARRYFDVV